MAAQTKPAREFDSVLRMLRRKVIHAFDNDTFAPITLIRANIEVALSWVSPDDLARDLGQNVVDTYGAYIDARVHAAGDVSQEADMRQMVQAVLDAISSLDIHLQTLEPSQRARILKGI